MGIRVYEFDNETRLVHFCLYFKIKDKTPESFDKVNGIWYVKEPAKIGTKIPCTSIDTILLPTGIKTLVWAYFHRQMAPGGYWEGWWISSCHWLVRDPLWTDIIGRLRGRRTPLQHSLSLIERLRHRARKFSDTALGR